MKLIHAAAAAGVAALAASTVIACSNHVYNPCYDDPAVVCDGNGTQLVYAPYIIPAYGVYGTPGWHAAVTIQPGAPNYHTTYINQPPNYTPTRSVPPPAANPRNTVVPPPSKVVTAPSVKAPSVGVNAPSVKAPSVSSGGGSKSSSGSSKK